MAGYTLAQEVGVEEQAIWQSIVPQPGPVIEAFMEATGLSSEDAWAGFLTICTLYWVMWSPP